FRILAYKEGDAVSLLSRNGIDRAGSFPEIAEAVRKLDFRTLLLDGEAVAFDRRGVSRFQVLEGQKVGPLVAGFDWLFRDGRDLRARSLTGRRAELESAIGKQKLIFVSRRLAADGLVAYRIARKKGYEGLVAKDASSPYIEGRSSMWLKVKVHQEEEFVI